MKAIQTKLLSAALAVLTLVVIVQSYFIYDLKQGLMEQNALVLQSQLGPNNANKQHHFLNAPSSDPLNQIQRMQEEMRKSFGRFNSIFSEDPFFKEAYGPSSLFPMSDIQENKNNYIIELNIPGSDEQNIEISNKGNQLKVFANSTSNKDDAGNNYIHKEKYSHSFSRSFTMPEDANLNNLSSDYQKGVLKITIPKRS